MIDMMKIKKNSLFELIMPVIMLQAALYIAACMKGISKEYMMLFVIQCILTLMMVLVTKIINGDSTMVLAIIALFSVGGFIQTVLSYEISGYEDGGRDFMYHLVIGFLVFLMVVILMNGRKPSLRILYTDKGCIALFIASILLYGVCLVGGRVGGAANWVQLGSLSLQLTEVSRLIYIWTLAVISQRKDFEAYGGRLLYMYFVHAVCLILVSELGFLIMITLLTGIVLTIRTEHLRALLISMKKPLLVLIVGFTAALVIVGAAYGIGEVLFTNPIHSFVEATYEKIKGRVLGFLHPEDYVYSYGYQAEKVNIAIFNGGMFGSDKAMQIPIVESDMVLAAIISSMGLIMGIVIIALYLLFFISGCQTALKKDSRFAMTLVTAVFIQACYNLGSVIGVVPVSGITLPFISAGGTSMVCMMVLVGLLVTVSGDKYPYFAEEGEENVKKIESYDIDVDGDLSDDIIDGSFSGKGRGDTGNLAGDRCQQGGRKGTCFESGDDYWSDN